MREIIKLRDITKKFGDVVATKDFNLSIETGKFVTFLGPSGCGKTTTLRCIAGLERPDKGEIYIREELMFSAQQEIFISPRDRDLSMVFQSYAVWPHMSVYENVAFGLKIKDMSSGEIRERVEDTLQVVGIEKLEERFPHELSGGQQQRVALARALVVEPAVLLMDEPLSNLDARLRLSMRSELKRIHHQTEASVVYVTHDQIEALSLSNRVVVMKEGVIQQVANPTTLYDFPANKFVAEFVGNYPMNWIPSKVLNVDGTTTKVVAEGDPDITYKISNAADIREGDQVLVGIRPEDVSVEKVENSKELNRQKRVFEITQVQVTGPDYIIKTQKDEMELTIQVEKTDIPSLNYGDKLLVDFSPEKTKVYHPETGELIR